MSNRYLLILNLFSICLLLSEYWVNYGSPSAPSGMLDRAEADPKFAVGGGCMMYQIVADL